MLQLENIGKHFGHRIICENINLRFPAGERIALVGPNGAGKTTLINILCGIEQPDYGRVHLPAGMKIGYLPQEPNPNPKPTVFEECLSGASKLYQMKTQLMAATEALALNHNDENLNKYEVLESQFRVQNGYTIESEAHTILSGLGFSEQHINSHPAQLSGGWRMRLELAKIFMNKVDILVLDEPTNHLDLPSLVWVEKYLIDFPGTLVFVSHDRSLLNRLSTHTYLLNSGKLETYACKYESFLKEREQRMAQMVAEKSNLEKKRLHMEAFVDRFGAKASKATQAQSRVKAAEKLRKQEESIDIPAAIQSKQVQIKLPTPPKSGKQVLEVKNLCIGYEVPLVKDLNFLVERGQKIAIIGANGIGKSTLIRTLVGRIKRLDGDIQFGLNVASNYYSQDPEDNLDLEKTPLENLLSASTEIGESEARSILGGFLFSGDDQKKPAKVCSGGEKARAALAKMLVNESNLLFLDEPTNHLDLESVDSLKQSIATYKGTCIFVSHNRNFIDACCTHILAITADGRSLLTEGKIEDYERAALREGFPNILSFEQTSPSNQATKASKKEPASDKNEAKKLKTRRQQLIKLISTNEKKQEKSRHTVAELEKEMSDLAGNTAAFGNLMNLQKELTNQQETLEQMEESWLELSDELEHVEQDLKRLGRL